MTGHEPVLERWLEAAIETRGGKAPTRVATESDPFRNPIGHVLRVNLSALLAQLTGAMEPAAIAKAFENIVAIRAVQDVSVEQALGFVYALRQIIRNEWPDADYIEMDRRIDVLSLSAFTQFLQCRERLLGLRLNEQLRALGPQPYRMRGMREQRPDAPNCSGCAL